MPTWSIRTPLGLGRRLGWSPDPLPWTRGDWAAMAVLAVASWAVWAPLAARAQDKLATLRGVENYAWAVYDQQIWNYAHTGQWYQTIHVGYDNSWDWSGHVALWMFPIAAIYKVFPGAATLAWVQIAAVVSGAFPLYFLGRRAIDDRAGALLASLAYLAWPALWAVALSDYQDLVLGVPFLIAAYAASQSGRAFPMAVFALLAGAAREEWLMLLPFVPLAAPGAAREKLRQAGVLALCVVPYLAFLAEVRMRAAATSQHGTPLLDEVQALLRWPPPFTRTYTDLRWFYAHFLEPYGWLGILSPLTLLPLALAWSVHAGSPPSDGVDAMWNGHIHHMAPICAVLAVGMTLGFGRVANAARALARRGGVGKLAAMGLLLGVGAVGAWGAADTRRVLDWIHVSPAISPFGTAAPAPEWKLLADNVPADASIATDTVGSLLVSGRHSAYTYDDSLKDKAPGRGLAAVQYLLVRKTDISWVQRAQQWPGGAKIGETKSYELWKLD